VGWSNGVLAGAGGSMFYDRSLDSSLFVAAEGFLGGNVFNNGLSGDYDCGNCLAFLAKDE
jgi:hypothetical protein